MFSISKGSNKNAIQECLKEVEKSPKDERLCLKLADLYLRNGDNEKAIKEYLRTGELYAGEDLNTRAIAVYRRVLSIDPEHVEAIHRMAGLYLKEGLLGDARGCYEKILKINPGDHEATKGLSVIRDSRRPKQVQTPSQRAEAVHVKSEIPSPENLSDEAEISLPNKDSELHYHLGIGYKEMGLFDYAITELVLASKDPSMKYDCYVLLGECFKERGDSEQSRRYFELASKIRERPKDGDSLTGISKLSTNWKAT